MDILKEVLGYAILPASFSSHLQPLFVLWKDKLGGKIHQFLESGVIVEFYAVGKEELCPVKCWFGMSIYRGPIYCWFGIPGFA